MFFSKPAGLKYVHRGDPSSNDYTLANFTADDNWYDLDLSAIIPKGSKLVAMLITLASIVANDYLELKKKGVVNDVNESKLYTIVSTMPVCYNILVPCDSDCIIQYKAALDDWTIIDIVISGWFV